MVKGTVVVILLENDVNLILTLRSVLRFRNSFKIIVIVMVVTIRH